MWWRHGTLRFQLLATTAAFTALPLIYFWALGRFDPVWRAGNSADQFVIPFASALVVIAPLAIPGLLAYRLGIPNFQSVVVRLWPLVALAEFQFIDSTQIGTYGLHSLQGLSVPLGVLAVTGISSLKIGTTQRSIRPVIAAILALLILVPSGWSALNSERNVGTAASYEANPYFITTAEQNALDYLKNDREPGSVLAPVYLGQMVPGETARSTWVGIYTWTPHFQRRATLADALFSGKLSAAQATQIIRASGVRFLLSDCAEDADLSNLVPVLDAHQITHFGCATVYRVASLAPATAQTSVNNDSYTPDRNLR
jgi:hypothetical protein